VYPPVCLLSSERIRFRKVPGKSETGHVRSSTHIER